MMSMEEKRKRNREYERAYYTNPERKAEKAARTKASYERARLDPNRVAKRKVYQQTWYAEQKRIRGGSLAQTARALHLKREYGISSDEYDTLLLKQNGQCCICGTASGTQTLHVDHCHTTGTIRGLLCNSCNTGLGHFRDNPALLQKAITYLKEFLQ